ncbi:MAG: tRNA glutamyl-Q(34) synthetase GluQRS [Pirellulaceae bacterium]
MAPSPTGGLHLGNARTFLINWALARQNNWNVALRIDDLDSPRVKAGADKQALEDLAWLGLDWDTQPLYQSSLVEQYDECLQRLASSGSIYPCRCTRSEIAARAASAPNEGDHELRYGGYCRPERRQAFDYRATRGEGIAWRFRVEVDNQPVKFTDEFCGEQSVSVDREVGDFIVANKQSVASYQLAVNVDDDTQGVTSIVRGDDLLTSTARQRLLRDALGMSLETKYWHLPLVQGDDGLRLAKRHCDTRLGQYRDVGVPRERVIGLIAFWSALKSLNQCQPGNFWLGLRLKTYLTSA